MLRICRNCRHWNAHSADEIIGDCMKELEGIPHRYSRAKMPDGSYAMLDSFGPEETKPTDRCGAFSAGSEIYA